MYFLGDVAWLGDATQDQMHMHSLNPTLNEALISLHNKLAVAVLLQHKIFVDISFPTRQSTNQYAIYVCVCVCACVHASFPACLCVSRYVARCVAKCMSRCVARCVARCVSRCVATFVSVCVFKLMLNVKTIGKALFVPPSGYSR